VEKMQLSYNVIKNNSVKDLGAKEIVTDAEAKVVKFPVVINPENGAASVPNVQMESYEKLAKSLIENARRQSEAILSRAYEDARLIEEDAAHKAELMQNEAFERGYSEGNEEGFNKAYNETMISAKREAEAIIASAEALLGDAKHQYEEYLKEKSQEISEMILTIAESVLKKEVQDSSTVKTMIFNALETSKNAKNFIIRCNTIYVEELKAIVPNWKEELGYLGDIFILKDDSLEIGNAVIDKGNGKVVVGVDIALQKISDILEGKD
jgi:flagellar assembly protein FliH